MATTNEDIKVVIEAEAGQFKTQMKDVIADLQTAQKEVANFSKSIQKGFGDIKSILIEVVKDTNSMQKNMSKSLSSISNKSDGMGGSVQSAMDMSGKSMMKFGAIAGAVGALTAKGIELILKAIKKVTTAIVDLVKKSISFAANAVESETLVARVFGEETEAIKDWSNELAKSFGLNAYEVRKNAATLFTMAHSIGATSQQAMTLAKSFTQLTSDMSAFYNETEGDMFRKLRSGITGETEPLRKLGVIITQTMVKEAAYRHGIAETGEELSEQQKILGRYMTIMEQTTLAQGAWSDEMMNPITALKILGNQLKSIATDFGALFLPIIAKIIPYVQSLVYVLRQAVSALQSFMGSLGIEVQDFGDKAKSGFEVAKTGAERASDAAKKLKKDLLGLAGFDEMNVLKEDDGSDSGGTGGFSDFTLPEYSMGKDKVNKAKEMGDKIIAIFKNIWVKMKEFFKPMKKFWDNTVGVVFEDLKIQWRLLGEALEGSPMIEVLKTIGEIILKIVVFAFTILVAVVVAAITGIIIWIKRFVAVKQWFTDVWEALGIIIDDFIKKTKKKIFDFIIKLIINWLILRNRVSEIWIDMMVNIKNKISKIASSVKSKIASIKSYFVGIWTTVKWVFQSIGNWMWSKISWAVSKVKGVLNSLKTGFTGFFVNIARSIKVPINWIIDKINTMIWTLNRWRIPKILPNGLNIRSIPRLAKGGIVSSPTLSMVGEAGREAVLPLENNTEWMGQLADKINSNGGNMHLTVKIGEDKILDKIIEGISDKSMRTNLNILNI